MTEAQLIRASLSSSRKELSEVFPRLSDEILSWAPAEGMRTIQGQLVEIIGTELSILEHLKGMPDRNSEEVDGALFACKSVHELKAKLDEVRSETLGHLDSLDDVGLNASAGVSEGFSDWLDLKPTPVSELFRYIARHEAYHTGQLVSYLWARGDNPYKWNS